MGKNNKSVKNDIFLERYIELKIKMGFIPVAVLLPEGKEEHSLDDPIEVLVIHCDDENMFYRSADMDQVECVRIHLRKREIVPVLGESKKRLPVVKLLKIKAPNKNGILVPKKKRVVEEHTPESLLQWTGKISVIYSKEPRWRELQTSKDKLEVLGKIHDYMPKKIENIKKTLLTVVSN
jgi:hypothetical protein